MGASNIPMASFMASVCIATKNTVEVFYMGWRVTPYGEDESWYFDTLDEAVAFGDKQFPEGYELDAWYD